MRRAVTGCARVYHVGADYRLWARDPRELHDTNVRGTIHVLDACLLARGRARRPHLDASGPSGSPPCPAPCDETTPLAPGQISGPYKRSKLEAERAALSYAERGLPVVVVNPTAPIGPWDAKPTPTGKILVDFAHGRIPTFVDTGLNVVHVRDVAEGHWLASERGRTGERYVLGNRNMTLREILGALAELLGRPAPRIRLPYAVAWAAGALSTAAANLVTHRPPAIPLEAVRMSRRRMFVDGLEGGARARAARRHPSARPSRTRSAGSPRAAPSPSRLPRTAAWASR